MLGGSNPSLCFWSRLLTSDCFLDIACGPLETGITSPKSSSLAPYTPQNGEKLPRFLWHRLWGFGKLVVHAS